MDVNAVTRAELKTIIWDWLDDPNGGYFSASVLNMRINLAQRELQKALISANKQYCSKQVYTPLVASQSAYALPSDFIQIVRLEYVTAGSGNTASTQPLMPTTPNQVDVGANASGSPVYYWFDKNNLILSPVPNSTQQLRLTYSYMVADLTSDSQSPDLPEQFHEYIAVLAARDCFLKDGRPLAPIESKMAEYKQSLKQIADQRNVDRPRMVVGTPGGFGGY